MPGIIEQILITGPVLPSRWVAEQSFIGCTKPFNNVVRQACPEPAEGLTTNGLGCHQKYARESNEFPVRTEPVEG